MQLNKKYHAWKADLQGNPIPNTERILTGTTKRNILKHLAYEEKVKHNHNDVLVRCKDGTTWHVGHL